MPTTLILAPHLPSYGTVLLVQLAIERPESRCKQLGLCIFDVDFLARFNVVRASDFRLALSKKIVVKMWYCRDQITIMNSLNCLTVSRSLFAKIIYTLIPHIIKISNNATTINAIMILLTHMWGNLQQLSGLLQFNFFAYHNFSQKPKCGDWLYPYGYLNLVE